MEISSRRFDNPEQHHQGWFQFYRFGDSRYEIWFGSRYWTVALKD